MDTQALLFELLKVVPSGPFEHQKAIIGKISILSLAIGESQAFLSICV